ncbi:pectin lyase fold domain-containing protein [Rhizobium phage RHph_I4]|nr:pectin lyase fold domain-containing protein [Rhizobium phage RHph_I4]
MAKKLMSGVPVASSEQIAEASILLLTSNNEEVKAPITRALGGTRAILDLDQTQSVSARLVSPNNVVEGITATFVANKGVSGLQVTKTAVTDANGFATVEFPTLARNTTHTMDLSYSTFLAVHRDDWFIAALAAATTLPTATSTGLVGDLIVVDKGVWSGSPTQYLFRYLRGTYVIPGANTDSYRLVADDADDIITAQVMAINAGGQTDWVSCNTIGPVANKPTTLVRAPVIAGNGDLGGHFIVTDPGEASNYAVPTVDEWEADEALIPAEKMTSTRYLIYSALSPGVPSSMPNAPAADNHNFTLNSNMYTGSNDMSLAIAANATENDYIYSNGVEPGVNGGNSGPQTWDLTLKHGPTATAIRQQVFIARVDSTGAVIGTEQQCARVGAAAGSEFAEFQPAQNGVYTFRVTYDFGKWNAGDRIRWRMRDRNTTASSANVRITVTNGPTFAAIPIGPRKALTNSRIFFTSTTALAGKALRLKRTFSNGAYTITAYSNAITLDPTVAQTVAPANTLAPTLYTATEFRQNTNIYADVGQWDNQPTSITFQWLRDDVDISGEVGTYHVINSADVGHVLKCRITATNAIGSTVITTDGVTALPPRMYYDIASGNDANDGQSTTTPKQTSAGSNSLASGSSAAFKATGVWGNRLLVGSNIRYESYDVGAKPSFGAPGVTFTVDAYTDDGSSSKSDVVLDGLRFIGDQRGIQTRFGSRWTIQNCDFDDIGFRPPSGQQENTQGIMIYKTNNIKILNNFMDRVYNDDIYIDTVNNVLINGNTILPCYGAEGDNIQTRADRFTPHQIGVEIGHNYLDMGSRKTGSGKGCIVTNMQSYAYIHDNELIGNNFGHGTDEGHHHSCCRNRMRHARKSSYSWLIGIGGYDNQGYSSNHQHFDNYLEDANRAHSYTGIGVSNYTGPISSRADIRCYDETIVNCTVGLRIDRPTSGIFRGWVFHNVGTSLSRVNFATVTEGTIHDFIYGDHFTYKGTIKRPPEVVTRSVVSGVRQVGQTLTATATVFDTAEVLAAFPGAVITRSYQWRRHARMPFPYTGYFLPFYGWGCDWIEGATGQSYTLAAEDVDCLVSRVERIHLTFTEGGVEKVVTALAYDGSYVGSAEIIA